VGRNHLATNAGVAFSYADGALDPVTTRKAVAEFGKPVLLLAGEYDVGLPPSTPVSSSIPS
jgi:proline iminopeptidase